MTAERATEARRRRQRNYAADRAAAAAATRADSAEGRCIGLIPPPADLHRKEACFLDLERFLVTYHADLFCLPFCADQKKAVAKAEQVVLEGRLFAVGMPRGHGKTVICAGACEWALLYGHRSFAVILGSDSDKAVQVKEDITTQFETNELLLADFPEVCHPIAALERISHRCRGQTYLPAPGADPAPTYMIWSSDKVAFPWIRGSQAAGSVIVAAGLTGSIRGTAHTRPDGAKIRPDLLLADDPQTDGSAASVSQTAHRERILAAAVHGMAGPRKKVACFMPCTVIAPNDLAERYLDRQRHPEWSGEKTRALYSLPADLEAWDRYAEARAAGLRADDGGRAANAYYLAHRAELETGAQVAWPENVREGDVSALQSIMNVRIDEPATFAAEYQMDPLPTIQQGPDALTPDDVAARVNAVERGMAPAGHTRMTAFVDVQQALLYWLVCAWQEDFGGAVVDYGAWPRQRRAYFTLADASPTLQTQAPGVDLRAQWWAGLDGLTGELLARDWPVDGGGQLRIERLLIDRNYAPSTEVVDGFCRQSAHAAILLPSRGKGIGASSTPISEWARRAGERRGLNWLIPAAQAGRPVRAIIYDTNWWKSFVAGKLQIPAGGKGGLWLFGRAPVAHRLFADHVCAEYRVRTKAAGREVDEWKDRPSHPDNHWWDCLVGCAVAASVQGLTPGGLASGPAPERRPVSFAERAARRRF